MTYEVREADAFVLQCRGYAGVVQGWQAAYDAAMFGWLGFRKEVGP